MAIILGRADRCRTQSGIGGSLQDGDSAHRHGHCPAMRAPAPAIAGRSTAPSRKSVPRRSRLGTPPWTDSLLLQALASLARQLHQRANVRTRSRDCDRRTSEAASSEEWPRPPVTPGLEAPHALPRSAQAGRRLLIGCLRRVVRRTSQYALASPYSQTEITHLVAGGGMNASDFSKNWSARMMPSQNVSIEAEFNVPWKREAHIVRNRTVRTVRIYKWCASHREMRRVRFGGCSRMT